LRAKIKHIVDDFHWKIISFYCQNYKTVIIPKLDTNGITEKIKRANRFASEIIIRRMKSLAHCRFVDRLKYKSAIYGTNIIIAKEDFTSKTCGVCGLLNNNLGSKKNF